MLEKEDLIKTADSDTHSKHKNGNINNI